MVDLVKTDITTLNFNQVIQGPTRFWPGVQPSMIDHCWGNSIEKIMNIKNLTRGAGDHNVISVTYKLKGKTTSRLEKLGRDRRNMSVEEFKRRLHLTDWSDVFQTNNVDIANYNFESKFLNILNDLAPMKRTQARKNRSDWISNTTKDKIKMRDQARERAAISSHQVEWERYKALRNECNRLIKKDRSTKLSENYENLQDNNDTKGLYRLAKKMGWKACGQPESFLINGKMITSPKDMANVQVNYFHDKVKNILEQLPPQTSDPLTSLREAFSRWGKAHQMPELILNEINCREVIDLIKKMGKSHSFGHEGIDSDSLKISQ